MSHTFRVTRPRASLALSVLLTLGVTGCNQRTIAQLEPDPEPVVVTDYPLSRDIPLDIVFVIDDSLSMAAEQRSLVENFPRFMNVLENIQGGLPDVHVGVISTDVGTGDGSQYCDANGYDGSLLANPSDACTVSPPSGEFIVDAPDGQGGRVRNYPEGQTLADTFACIAELGTAGCAFEQPLESLRRALDGHNALNDGFLRPEAYLAVVFITDEDDCSVTDNALFGSVQDALDNEIGRRGSFRCWQYGVICDPDDPLTEGEQSGCRVREEPRNPEDPMVADVQQYVDFIKDLKFSEQQILVAGIMGASGPIRVTRDDRDLLDLEKSCGAVEGDPYSGAVPATRLEAFLDSFENSTQTTICDGDLSSALDQVAREVARIFQDRCIPGQIFDTDGATQGLQPECSITETLYPGTPMAQETVLEQCDNQADPASSSNQPCYMIAPDPDCSETATGLAVEVYPTDRSVPATAILSLQCLAE